MPRHVCFICSKPTAGFTLRTEGVKTAPANRVEDAAASAPEVKPKEGLGPVKFGMTKEQVIDKIGKPDKIDQKGTALDYPSRGYSVLVSPKRGVMLGLEFTLTNDKLVQFSLSPAS